MIEMIPFDAASNEHIATIARLWSEACGTEFSVSPAFVHYNTQPVPGHSQAGQLALQDGQPVGFVLASAASDPLSDPPAWIDAIAVQPTRQGTGTRLMDWAENWLAARGCRYLRLGGSIRPFAPGLPGHLDSEPFFARRGYTHPAPPFDYDWDVARDLVDYQPDPPYTGPADFRPCQPGEEAALLEFVRREFPGRWQFEVEEYLRIGGRVADIMLAWINGRVEGFCWCTYPDSQRPLERYYHYELPKPWGQAGPLGVSQAVRSKGLGRSVVNAALAHMQQRGIRGCVIDWTSLLDFYAIFGFQKYHRYLALFKALPH